MDYNINLPFTEDEVKNIKAGDVLYLNGVVYTARDAAHKRLYDAVNDMKAKASAEGKILSDEEIRAGLPIDIKGAIVYYLGPTPARPGQVIGSAGPTTSTRMDKYTPTLLDLGMAGMIGKGRRAEDVRVSIGKNHAVYMGATGGAGALLSKCIKKAEVVCYDDLGTEAIRRLEVENFPVTVLIDSEGTVFVP